jgi:hypothetical protein
MLTKLCIFPKKTSDAPKDIARLKLRIDERLFSCLKQLEELIQFRQNNDFGTAIGAAA